MSARDLKEAEYEGYRQAARQAAVAYLAVLARTGQTTPNLLRGLNLTAIDDRALAAAYGEWGTPAFRWTRICGQFRPYVRRFEVAIWLDGNLEGLCIGRSSRGPDNVTLHFLERAPQSIIAGHVAEIATDAAEAYASVIGRRRLKIKNPVAGALRLYGTLGFTLAETYRGSTYYERIVP